MPAYGYAYGRAYGTAYGVGKGTGGWVFEFPEVHSHEANGGDGLEPNDTKSRSSRFAARSKPLELRAATLWLRSHARSADEETALSVGEACARVGVAARFKQNVWNATKRARAGGWADDGAADEFLDPPTTESVRSAEG